jgi:hypothetical protein
MCAHRAQTIPTPIALKVYQKAHFIASFLNMQAYLVFTCSTKNGEALFLDSCQTCPISHFKQRNSSVHGFLARTTCTYLITTESYNIAICIAVLIRANTPPPVDVDVDNIYITISTSWT